MTSTPLQNKRGPGRPRNIERIDRKKSEILKVSSSLFAENGFKNTDVQEIADRLGVAKGTIYHYFQSKEKLFLASVDSGMEKLSEFINSSVEDIKDPIKKIAGAIHYYLVFFDKNPQLIELIVQERAEFKDRKKPTYMVHREKNIKPWHELFESLTASGRLREVDAETTTLTISNLLYGTIFTTYYSYQGISFESQTKQILSLVFAGILSDKERAKIDEYASVNLPKHGDK